MSGPVRASKARHTHLIEAAAFVALIGALAAVNLLAPEAAASAQAITSVGFLLLGGALAAGLLEGIKVPHLTGYLLAGIIAGPHVLGLIHHATVERLSVVNTLALSLIALAGGTELELSAVRQNLRQLNWALVTQCFGGLVLMMCVFVLAQPVIPFAHGMSLAALFGVGALWATLAISRSPAAVLGVLAETRAKGPLADFTLTFVMASDVVVVLVLAIVITTTRPLLDAGGAISARAFLDLWHEVLGSAALGTTLGLGLIVYLKWIRRQLLLILVALGFVFTEVVHYVRFDPLLTFIVAGFLVRNLSRQGTHLLGAIEKTGGVVYVVFFATAGAHLNLPLLAELWPAALVLAVGRVLVTVLFARASGAAVGDTSPVRKWGWVGLISQAGLSIGIAVVIERQFPEFGSAFRALAIATVAINEMAGPVLFKFALDRLRESATSHEARGPRYDQSTQRAPTT